MEEKKVTEKKKEDAMTREDFAVLWKTIHLKITDTYDVPPEILWVNGSTFSSCITEFSNCSAFSFDI